LIHEKGKKKNMGESQRKAPGAVAGVDTTTERRGVEEILVPLLRARYRPKGRGRKVMKPLVLASSARDLQKERKGAGASTKRKEQEGGKEETLS